MKLFTQFGYFAVGRGDRGSFVLRACRRADMVTLCGVAGVSTDGIEACMRGIHRYEMELEEESFLSLMVALGGAVDYAGFKAQVATRHDQRPYTRAYAAMWKRLGEGQGALADSTDVVFWQRAREASFAMEGGMRSGCGL